MREGPRLGLHLTSKIETKAILDMRRYWEGALKSEFPLAPADLIEDKKVTKESYAEAKRNFVEFLKKAMIEQMDEMAGKTEEEKKDFMDGPRGIQVFSSGELEFSWALEATVNFNSITYTDVAPTAVRDAKKIIKKQKLNSAKCSVLVQESEVLDAWESGLIRGEDEEHTLFYYAGRFIQNQNKEDKDKILKHFGEFLKRPTNQATEARNRRIYLLHPLGEDNPRDKVKWRRTIPYTMDELRAPLEEGFVGPIEEGELRAPLEAGFGGHLNMEVVGTHEYFGHQKYSLICVSVPANG